MSLINLARAVITVLWFVLFVAMWITVWYHWRHDSYPDVARLPLESSDRVPAPHEERT
jgi:hypothetical protein